MPLKVDEKLFAEKAALAIRQQERLNYVREESAAHQTKLKAAAASTRTHQEFASLIARTFDHHELSEFSRIARSEVRINDRETIAKWFHHKYFLPVVLRRGNSEKGEVLPTDELFERITQSLASRSSNNVQFLVGPVGVGKSTFVCNLLYVRWQQFMARKILPVRINVDVLTDHNVPPKYKIARTLYDQILASMAATGTINRQTTDYLRRNTRIRFETDESHILEMLASLIETLNTHGKYSLLLVIDNIDFLYHIGDRGSFARVPHEEQQLAYEAILDFVRIFSRSDQACSKLGMNVLYCMRRDTLEYMESKLDEVPSTDLTELSAFFGETELSAEIRHARAVIEKRFELLADLAEEVPETAKKEEIRKQALRLGEWYGAADAARPALISDLWRISKRGLRDLVDQVRQYSWIEHGVRGGADLNTRFSEQYSPAMLAYTLGGRERYAQFTGGIPNLYLVNANVPSTEYAVPVQFKESHFTTYWLKRLILEYLKATAGEFISVNQVVEVFTGRNGRGYSENLVRYLLGNLSQVPQSELIQADIGATGAGGRNFYVKRIHLTRRGRFLLDRFADSFSYLQIVVDDWRLPIPRSLQREFAYVEPDYGYLVADNEEYSKQSVQVLEKKSKQALIFAILLEEYLTWEKKLWPNVFSRLFDIGVVLPEPGDLTKKISRDIDVVTQRVSLARAVAFDIHCSPAFLSEKRRIVRGALAELAGPQLKFLREVYEVRDAQAT